MLDKNVAEKKNAHTHSLITLKKAEHIKNHWRALMTIYFYTNSISKKKKNTHTIRFSGVYAFGMDDTIHRLCVNTKH